MLLNSVRGTHDLIGEEWICQQWLLRQAQTVAENYGYEGISTPLFESTEVFKRTLGESSDIVHKQMYTFPDNNGDHLTLRPEGTAGIARTFISHNMQRQVPVKFYYFGPMFRYERPQKGRQRQFHQFGIELIGVSTPQADVECLAMAHTLFSQLGLNASTRIEINTIGDLASRQTYRKNLIAYLEKYQKELSADSQRRLQINPLRILDSKDPQDQKILESAPTLESDLNKESKVFFDQILEGLQLLHIPYQINPRLVRGLDYYSHSVFEFKNSSLGAQDTVLGGGRYDGLIELMGGPSQPGVGWGIGIERLMLLIPSHQWQSTKQRPSCLIPLGELAEKKLELLAFQLRNQGFSIEMDFSGNLKKRLQRAIKSRCRWALILGDEELNRNVITVKDLDKQIQFESAFSLESLNQGLTGAWITCYNS